MIATVNHRVRDWILDVLGSVTVSFTAPDSTRQDAGVSVYLLEIIETPPPRNRGRAPLAIGLRYLLTTYGSDVHRAHDQLANLVFAAMEHPQFEAEVQPLDASAWTALGAVPQPSFLLGVPFRVERPETQVKTVRHPLVTEITPVTSLRGRVVGPGDVPLPMAWVELTSLGLVSYTGKDGWFAFAAVPVEPRQRDLRVRLKDREMDVQTDKGEDRADPLIIRFNKVEA